VLLLHHSKQWLTLAQLVPHWARQLAHGETDASRVENDLWHDLIEDIINGRFDSKRPGLMFIKPDWRAVPVQGQLLIGMLGLSLGRSSHRILVRKKAVLDFARRHNVPLPSWWADKQRREGRTAEKERKNIVATGARTDHAARRSSADPSDNRGWRAKPGVRLTIAEAAVLEAITTLWPGAQLDHNAKARDNRIVEWLKERSLSRVSSRTIQRTLQKVIRQGATRRDLARPGAE
jgi:hypothetical protein